MTVPCLIGMRCPHCMRDGDGGGARACFYPCTSWTIGDDTEGIFCEDVSDCPLIEYGSELDRLMHYGEESE